MVIFNSIFVLLALLLSGMLALPSPDNTRNYHEGDDHEEDRHDRDCLTDNEARFLADTFKYFYIRLDPRLVEKYMAPDFHDYSDSYISLYLNGSKALGSPVSASRDEFIQNHFVDPPVYPEGSPNWFILEDIFHTCTKISFRWVLEPDGTFNIGPLPIRGNNVMHTVKRDGKWLMKAEWSEFNTYAWAQNLGVCA
ncbi:hypothetical protein W97_07724 [Coniosporium apollinis CBS 100218]|uniref:NTF2-like domain-containing protein n=1 Tax=Coniosporium apollinis (strain CBS 100218) TaxID=1168221 RepID=R7Z2H8_CONA1|nr:uncharacterized protein W97_07724 [Coniosporium apollinis CBS 100218]EON68400.1 hypothetical protein W97_07724 [Coniosporium apollinis CBS 100218]